jgi:hypothetical protein
MGCDLMDLQANASHSEQLCASNPFLLRTTNSERRGETKRRYLTIRLPVLFVFPIFRIPCFYVPLFLFLSSKARAAPFVTTSMFVQ